MVLVLVVFMFVVLVYPLRDIITVGVSAEQRLAEPSLVVHFFVADIAVVIVVIVIVVVVVVVAGPRREEVVEEVDFVCAGVPRRVSRGHDEMSSQTMKEVCGLIRRACVCVCVLCQCVVVCGLACLSHRPIIPLRIRVRRAAGMATSE